MDAERVTALLQAHADLEAAARVVWAESQKRAWSIPQDCDCEDCHALVAMHDKIAALDALRAEHEAHPAVAHHCETCAFYTHSGCGLASVGYRMTNGRGFYPPPTFGCTEWRAKP
jgi:hypothetical protein